MEGAWAAASAEVCVVSDRSGQRGNKGWGAEGEGGGDCPGLLAERLVPLIKWANVLRMLGAWILSTRREFTNMGRGKARKNWETLE